MIKTFSQPRGVLDTRKAIHTEGRIHTVSYKKYDHIGITQRGQPRGGYVGRL